MTRTESKNRISLMRVAIKGLLLFLAIDLLYIPVAPLASLGMVSAYNIFFPGRLRLPYGEKPDLAYNFSLYNLDAMFASHILAAKGKPSNEYRVLLIGDSSVWGYLLTPEDMLSADINAAHLTLQDGRVVRAYNLGYPTLSLTKDLLIIKYALKYQPDLIIWLLTLESFPRQKQLDSPILQNNPLIVKDLISEFNLNLDIQDPRFVIPSFWDRSLIGERRALADIFRLQLYGTMWAATGIDQYYPSTYDPPQEDLSPDDSFQGLRPPQLYPQDLSMDVLIAGSKLSGTVPIILVNEPIYLSHGENSDIRYNFFYPHWAYDQYRQLLASLCQSEGWQYLDEWDLIPSTEFTNSAIHMTPYGTRTLSVEIGKAILSRAVP